MIEELTALEHLLRRHGHYGQADVVDRLLRLHATGQRNAFEEEVLGLSMWGGSGSVADVNLGYGSPRSEGEAQDDVTRFYALMAALSQALEVEGLGSPRTRQVGADFQSWLAQGA